MSVDDPQPSTGAAPPGRRFDWRVGALAVVLVLLLGGLIAQTVRSGAQYGRLLRTDPDAIVRDKTLTRFAADAAKPVFDKHCAGCHGADLKGDRARGVPDMTDADWLYGAGRPAEVERTILYGIRSGLPRSWNLADMPAFGQAVPYSRYKIAPLKPQDIRDVIEYLQVLENKPSDSVAAARGAKIYADTGQCFDCHANDGAGDTAIGAPSLIDTVWLYGDGSRESLFKSIAHGHRGVCPAWIGRLKPGEIRALAVYIAGAAKVAKPPPTQAAAVQQQGKPS